MFKYISALSILISLAQLRSSDLMLALKIEGDEFSPCIAEFFDDENLTGNKTRLVM